MQVSEGQRGGDHRLNEHGVHADGQGAHGNSFQFRAWAG
jgi:hypothetical protein